MMSSGRTSKRVKAGDFREEEFQRKQMRLRCLARLNTSQGWPIDYVARAFFSMKGEEVPVDVEDVRYPFLNAKDFIRNLERQQVIDLREQISKFKEVFNVEEADKLFWTGFELLADFITAEKAITDSPQSQEEDVAAIIKGKTREQISELRNEVEAEIKKATASSDERFWKTVLMRIRERESTLCLEEFTENAKNKTKKLPAHPDDFLLTEEVGDEVIVNDFDSFVTEQNEKAFSSFVEKSLRMASGEKKSERSQLALESLFVEKTADVPAYFDLFRPLRPQFFNRVKLGYEWNAINRSKYTKKDPPPRSVFGYRFNIFFPFKTSEDPPSYSLHPLADPHFAVIEFRGGTPYHPIFFKIANGPWNMADRKTFKCSFENGVFHLYFDFHRARAKR